MGWVGVELASGSNTVPSEPESVKIRPTLFISWASGMLDELFQTIASFGGAYGVAALLVIAPLVGWIYIVTAHRGPEFLYKVFDKKLTREQFYQLCNRFMLFGLFFGILAAVVVLSVTFMNGRQTPAPLPKAPDLDHKVRNVIWRPDEIEYLEGATNECPDSLLKEPNELRPWGEIEEEKQKSFGHEYETRRKEPQVDLLLNIGDGSPPHFLLGECYSFEIRKGTDTKKMIIKDVVVDVIGFRTMPPTSPSGAAFIRIPIIIVPLENKGPDAPLPWRFRAKWLVREAEIVPFSSEQVSLITDGYDPFIVKIGAQNAGLYIYKVSVIVQSDDKDAEEILLTPKPRYCLFHGQEFGPDDEN